MKNLRRTTIAIGLAFASALAIGGTAVAYYPIYASASTSSQGTFYPEAQIPSCAVQYGANQGTNEAWAYPVNNCNLHDVGARAWYQLPGSGVTYYTNIAWGRWGNHTVATGDIRYAKGYMGY